MDFEKKVPLKDLLAIEANGGTCPEMEALKEQSRQLFEMPAFVALRDQMAVFETGPAAKLREQMQSLDLGISSRLKDLALHQKSLISESAAVQLAHLAGEGNRLSEQWRNMDIGTLDYLVRPPELEMSSRVMDSIQRITPVSEHYQKCH